MEQVLVKDEAYEKKQAIVKKIMTVLENENCTIYDSKEIMRMVGYQLEKTIVKNNG